MKSLVSSAARRWPGPARFGTRCTGGALQRSSIACARPVLVSAASASRVCAAAANREFASLADFGSTAASHTELRSHVCGTLRAKDVGEEVSLCGWVQVRASRVWVLHKLMRSDTPPFCQTVRPFGAFTFVVLRDYSGTVQVVVRGGGLRRACAFQRGHVVW